MNDSFPNTLCSLDSSLDRIWSVQDLVSINMQRLLSHMTVKTNHLHDVDFSTYKEIISKLLEKELSLIRWLILTCLLQWNKMHDDLQRIFRSLVLRHCSPAVDAQMLMWMEEEGVFSLQIHFQQTFGEVESPPHRQMRNVSSGRPERRRWRRQRYFKL